MTFRKLLLTSVSALAIAAVMPEKFVAPEQGLARAQVMDSTGITHPAIGWMPPNQANNATNATNAVNATNATNATNAVNAQNANTANSANTANWASTAATAGVAGSANYATDAGYAYSSASSGSAWEDSFQAYDSVWDLHGVTAYGLGPGICFASIDGSSLTGIPPGWSMEQVLMVGGWSAIAGGSWHAC